MGKRDWQRYLGGDAEEFAKTEEVWNKLFGPNRVSGSKQPVPTFDLRAYYREQDHLAPDAVLTPSQEDDCYRLSLNTAKMRRLQVHHDARLAADAEAAKAAEEARVAQIISDTEVRVNAEIAARAKLEGQS